MREEPTRENPVVAEVMDLPCQNPACGFSHTVSVRTLKGIVTNTVRICTACGFPLKSPTTEAPPHPNMSPEIYTKIRRGDALSDAELETAISFFRRVSEDLSRLGAVFQLPFAETNRTLEELCSFKRARERQ